MIEMNKSQLNENDPQTTSRNPNRTKTRTISIQPAQINLQD